MPRSRIESKSVADQAIPAKPLASKAAAAPPASAARYAAAFLDYARTECRLADNTVQSIETSSLHLDLISDLKRINSHICSIAYPILDSAGALAPTRFRLPEERSQAL